MESVGTLSAGEWTSFNGVSTDEADFMAQLLGTYSTEQDACLTLGTPSSSTWPSHVSTMNMAISSGGDESAYCSDTLNSSNHHLFYYHPQEVNYSTSRCASLFLPTPGRVGSYSMSHSGPTLMNNDDTSLSMNICVVNQQNSCSSMKSFSDNVIEEGSFLKQEFSSGSLGDQSCENPHENFVRKRKCEISEPDSTTEDNTAINTNSLQRSKKKSRVSGDVGKNKKNQKLDNDEEETTNNGGMNRQNSCSYSSEDESIAASQEINGCSNSTKSSKKSGALNLNGKTRASRGSATDPQSLYARKRRERINERLRILQNLVPNGTKVDISTMLEEAVEYVKFLQLQIKLLSSDDLWMYAPIAYNGMDIGLDRKLSSPI